MPETPKEAPWSDRLHDIGELAFEHDVEGSPDELWRLLSTTEFRGEQHQRGPQWFTSYEAAHDYATRLEARGSRIVSLTQYRRTP